VKPEQPETYKVVAQHKKEGIRLLYERYGKKLHGYAQFTWRLTEDEAWDIVYKTLYKVLDSTASYTFESEKKYGGFIFKVFVNYLRQNYRDNKKNIATDYTDFSSVDIPAEEESENVESVKSVTLRNELEKLEDWERMLLLLRSQNMPYSEIAKFVHKPEEQLKVYYQRLKATLTKRMNEQLASDSEKMGTDKKNQDEKL